MWSWPLQCPKAFDIVRHQVTITVCIFLLIFIHCAELAIWVELHHLSFNPAELQWPRHLTEIQKPRFESWLDLNFIFFSGGFIYKYQVLTHRKLLHRVLCEVHSSVIFSGKHSTVKDLFFFEEWIGTKCITFMWCFVYISRPYSLSSRLIINFNRLNQTVTHDITLAC